MIGWLLFFLASLVSLAQLADFFLGREGNRALKEALADFYVAVERDWRAAYRAPAALLTRFLDHLLTRRLGTSVLRLLAVSVSLTTLLFVAAQIVHLFSASYDEGEWWLRLVTLCVINATGDVLTWSVARSGLRYIQRAGIAGALAATAAMVGSALVVPAAFYIESLFVIDQLLFGPAGPVKLGLIPFAVGNLFIGGGSGMFMVIPLVVLLPVLLFAFVVVLGIGATVLQPVAKRPLMLVLERVDASTKPFFTLASLFIGAIATLITGYAKARGLI
jgi:hypothetical protein